MVDEWTELLGQLGQRLRNLRRTRGLRQSEVAVRMGLDQHTGQPFIWRIESGRAGIPNLKTLVDFLRACGLEPGTPDELLDRLGVPRVEAPIPKPGAKPVPAVKPETVPEPKPVSGLPVEAAVAELRQLLTPPRKERAGNAEPSLYWQMMLEVHRVLDEFLCDQPGRLVQKCQFSWYKMLGRRVISFYRRYPPKQAAAKLAELRVTWQGHGEVSELHDAVVELALRGWRHWVAKVGEEKLKVPSRSKLRAPPAKRKAETAPEPEPAGPTGPKPGSEEWRLRVHRLETRVTGALNAAVQPWQARAAALPDFFRRPNVYTMVGKFYSTWKQLQTRRAPPEVVAQQFDAIVARFIEMGAGPEVVALVRGAAEKMLVEAG